MCLSARSCASSPGSTGVTSASLSVGLADPHPPTAPGQPALPANADAQLITPATPSRPRHSPRNRSRSEPPPTRTAITTRSSRGTLSPGVAVRQTQDRPTRHRRARTVAQAHLRLRRPHVTLCSVMGSAPRNRACPPHSHKPREQQDRRDEYLLFTELLSSRSIADSPTSCGSSRA